jgi:hypothetical protein
MIRKIYRQVDNEIQGERVKASVREREGEGGTERNEYGRGWAREGGAWGEWGGEEEREREGKEAKGEKERKRTWKRGREERERGRARLVKRGEGGVRMRWRGTGDTVVYVVPPRREGGREKKREPENERERGRGGARNQVLNHVFGTFSNSMSWLMYIKFFANK